MSSISQPNSWNFEHQRTHLEISLLMCMTVRGNDISTAQLNTEYSICLSQEKAAAGSMMSFEGLTDILKQRDAMGRKAGRPNLLGLLSNVPEKAQAISKQPHRGSLNLQHAFGASFHRQ